MTGWIRNFATVAAIFSLAGCYVALPGFSAGAGCRSDFAPFYETGGYMSTGYMNTGFGGYTGYAAGVPTTPGPGYGAGGYGMGGYGAGLGYGAGGYGAGAGGGLGMSQQFMADPMLMQEPVPWDSLYYDSSPGLAGGLFARAGSGWRFLRVNDDDDDDDRRKKKKCRCKKCRRKDKCPKCRHLPHPHPSCSGCAGCAMRSQPLPPPAPQPQAVQQAPPAVYGQTAPPQHAAAPPAVRQTSWEQDLVPQYQVEPQVYEDVPAIEIIREARLPGY